MEGWLLMGIAMNLIIPLLVKVNEILVLILKFLVTN
jgi:hypothetical protein